MVTALASGSALFVAVDASVWISSILSFDSNHVAASNWINNHVNNGGYLVAPLILALEVGAAVARVVQNKSLAQKAVSELYAFSYLQLVPLDQSLVDDAVDISISFSIRGADALYVAVAKQFGIPLVTLDNEQLTRPTSLITTIKP